MFAFFRLPRHHKDNHVIELFYFTRIIQWNFYDVEYLESKFSKTWKMETKEKDFTSLKELIKSKFSSTWKMEIKQKFLTS